MADISITPANMVKVAIMVIVAGFAVKFLNSSTGLNLPSP